MSPTVSAASIITFLAGNHHAFQPLESRPDMHAVNFRWRNQRQLRKNVRRARAAGVKKSRRVSMSKWS